MKNHITGLNELIYSPIWTRVASLLLRKIYDWHNANKMRCTVYLLLHLTFHVLSFTPYNELEMYWPIKSFAKFSQKPIFPRTCQTSRLSKTNSVWQQRAAHVDHTVNVDRYHKWELVNINLPAKYSNSKQKLGPLVLTEIDWVLGIGM